jgi:polyhydroxyalkanoate synthase
MPESRPVERGVQWFVFEQFDRLRRAQGALMDLAGFGPWETPYRVIHEEAGVALRRYGSGEEEGPPVLVVPAPIKRPYVWDATPEVSVVRRCLAAGLRPYLLDWQPAPPEFGLQHYAERLIENCLDAIGERHAILLAHSLGGLFAAIFAALHPQRVQGLVLLTTPLHFGAATPVFSAMISGIDAESLPEELPGSFLSATSLGAAPDTFGSERFTDLLLSFANPATLRTHLQAERWALDEFPLPRRLVAELAMQIVRDDRFARGLLEIGGHRPAPSGLVSPLLCVIDPRCRLVPPESVLAVVRAAASTDKTVLEYHGDVGVSLQHLGPLIGTRAHAELWPKILRWIDERFGKQAA